MSPDISAKSVERRAVQYTGGGDAAVAALNVVGGALRAGDEAFLKTYEARFTGWDLSPSCQYFQAYQTKPREGPSTDGPRLLGEWCGIPEERFK